MENPAQRISNMASNKLRSVPNPDLVVGEGRRTRWNTAEHRRWGFHNWGFHNLYRNGRYGLSLRSRDVLPLRRDIDRRTVARSLERL
jgi:hypothetical protein